MGGGGETPPPLLMASALNLLADWAGDGGERHNLLNSEKGLLMRWLNQAQLRFADKSEVLQSVWEPTITSGGSIALPSNFLREIKDRVKWTADVHLVKIDYPTAINNTFSTTNYYAIFGGTFYVFAAAAGTPTIPFIKSPAAITNLSSAELEIPSEYHHNLILFLDAMFARKAGDVKSYMILMKEFDRNAEDAGMAFKIKRDGAPVTNGGFF